MSAPVNEVLGKRGLGFYYLKTPNRLYQHTNSKWEYRVLSADKADDFESIFFDEDAQDFTDNPNLLKAEELFRTSVVFTEIGGAARYIKREYDFVLGNGEIIELEIDIDFKEFRATALRKK